MPLSMFVLSWEVGLTRTEAIGVLVGADIIAVIGKRRKVMPVSLPFSDSC